MTGRFEPEVGGRPAAIRKAAMEKIEDECDVRAYVEAKRKFDADPVTFSHEEVKRKLGLL